MNLWRDEFSLLQKTMRVVLVAGLGLSITACAGFLSSGPTAEEKEEFLRELDSKHLTDRERCFRLYRFDKYWARSFSSCRALVDSLDALERTPKDEITVDGVKVEDAKVEPPK